MSRGFILIVYSSSWAPPAPVEGCTKEKPKKNSAWTQRMIASDLMDAPLITDLRI